LPSVAESAFDTSSSLRYRSIASLPLLHLYVDVMLRTVHAVDDDDDDDALNFPSLRN
jgi:hypothetical protein